MFELFARRLVMQVSYSIFFCTRCAVSSADQGATVARCGRGVLQTPMVRVRPGLPLFATAEPDLLKSWYGYFCDHYNNGTPYKVHPAESGAPLEG
eukprot:1698852-Rhodomonas_salina.1